MKYRAALIVCPVLLIALCGGAHFIASDGYERRDITTQSESPPNLPALSLHDVHVSHPVRRIPVASLSEGPITPRVTLVSLDPVDGGWGAHAIIADVPDAESPTHAAIDRAIDARVIVLTSNERESIVLLEDPDGARFLGLLEHAEPDLDLTRDGEINGDDFERYLDHFTNRHPLADIDADRSITQDDLHAFIRSWDDARRTQKVPTQR